MKETLKEKNGVNSRDSGSSWGGGSYERKRKQIEG